MNKQKTIATSVLFTLLMLLILNECDQYNNLSFMLGMFSGAFAAILPNFNSYNN